MIELAKRSRQTRHPPVVAICDISGSMADYTRIFLHFLHALTEKRRRVHTFLFGTRLTNVTRALRHKDPDEALALCTAEVEDWSGGTRIGTCLHRFNRDWSRRVLGQGAIVLLFTDGLEREGTQELAREMERLHKSSRRVIWLNPLLRYDRFEPLAQGIRAMLPQVDEFRPVHNLSSIQALAEALSGQKAGRATDPKLWLRRGGLMRTVFSFALGYVSASIRGGNMTRFAHCAAPRCCYRSCAGCRMCTGELSAARGQADPAFRPGTATDIAARMIGEKLQSKWGKGVVIENRAGGDGLIAIRAFLQGGGRSYAFVFVDGVFHRASLYTADEAALRHGERPAADRPHDRYRAVDCGAGVAAREDAG